MWKLWKKNKTVIQKSSILVFGLASLGFLTTFALQPSVRSTAAIPKPKLNSKRHALIKNLKNWGIYNGSKSHSHVDALSAWDIEDGSKDIVVAVIDTGIDNQHPDLKSNIWKSNNGVMQNCSSSSGLRPSREVQNQKIRLNFNQPSNETTSRQGALFGWDLVTNQPNPSDDHGHGTHVAGIIGATANPQKGISGVAQKVSLMAVKYYSQTNSGLMNLQNTVRGIHCAVDNGAKIINYSGGGPKYSHEEYLAIKKAESKGVLIVAAAGNNSQDTDKPENRYYPAAYRTSNVISVAAIDIQNKLLSSSNWGMGIDVAAPGEDIYSTLPGGGYGKMTGTSQATAFVSGIAALILAKKPHLSPSEVIKLIRDSVVPIKSLKEKIRTGGRVSAFRALRKLLNPDESLPGIVAFRRDGLSTLLKSPFVSDSVEGVNEVHF